MASIDPVRPQADFSEQHRAQPLLVGIAVGVSTFLLGIALLPQPRGSVAVYDGPEAIDMMGPMPAVQLASVTPAEVPLPVATGVFEETPPEAIHEVWG